MLLWYILKRRKKLGKLEKPQRRKVIHTHTKKHNIVLCSVQWRVLINVLLYLHPVLQTAWPKSS